MKFRYLSVLVLFFWLSHALAQHSNEATILGCWTLTNMKFPEPVPDGLKLVEDALGTVVCFESPGTFNTQKKGAATGLKGKYSLSADGTILYQSTDGQQAESDEGAEIITLDKKQLIFKLPYATMYFERE